MKFLPHRALGAFPKVSVVIGVKNGAATLQSCLDSIAAQEFTSREAIVIDSASTDGTRELLESNRRAGNVWRSRLRARRGRSVRGLEQRRHAQPRRVGLLSQAATMLSTTRWRCTTSSPRPTPLGAEAGMVYGLVNRVTHGGVVAEVWGAPLAGSEGRIPCGVHDSPPGQPASPFDLEQRGLFDESYRVAGDSSSCCARCWCANRCSSTGSWSTCASAASTQSPRDLQDLAGSPARPGHARPARQARAAAPGACRGVDRFVDPEAARRSSLPLLRRSVPPGPEASLGSGRRDPGPHLRPLRGRQLRRAGALRVRARAGLEARCVTNIVARRGAPPDTRVVGETIAARRGSSSAARRSAPACRGTRCACSASSPFDMVHLQFPADPMAHVAASLLPAPCRA